MKVFGTLTLAAVLLAGCNAADQENVSDRIASVAGPAAAAAPAPPPRPGAGSRRSAR